MSPDEFALLQAVRANPADDTPRLVYADWLQDRGDESGVARAEYIRLECAADKLKEGTPEYQELEKRSSALMEAFGDGWRRELEQRIQSRYPQVQFGRPPDGDVFDMLYDRGFITTLTISWDGLYSFPDLAPIVGPIEFLSLHFADGQQLSVLPLSENWNFRKLKVLELRSAMPWFDQMLSLYGVLNIKTGGDLASVPILRLVTSGNRTVPAGVAGYVLNGQMNPVLLFDQGNGLPMFHSVVVDPLLFWPMLKPWADRFFVDTWHVDDPALTDAQRQRVPSARYPHLVRYYQLAGLPPPSPTAERVPKGVPPKRGVLSRAARWFRKR